MSRNRARPTRATHKVRDDIDPENTWVVSDTHFGHSNIVGFCHRPEDHEQVMIAEWRAHVPDDATVLHLGDICYRSNDLRVHGHIHNNGYSRDEFVPFLLNHINLSVEQTKYRPVNLKLLLDAVLLGQFPETSGEQLAEAAARKEAHNAARN